MEGDESCMKITTERQVGSVIKSLENGRSLRLECVRVLEEELLVPGMDKERII